MNAMRKAIVGRKSDLISRELRRAMEEPFVVSSVPQDVERVLSFVREHLFDPKLSVDRLRTHCQLRNHNISTRFKGVVGMGIRQYIEEQRIGVARRLLKHSELEVWRVATSVGFSSAEAFCRSFRRRVGFSPSEYRAQTQHLLQDSVNATTETSPDLPRNATRARVRVRRPLHDGNADKEAPGPSLALSDLRPGLPSVTPRPRRDRL